MQIEVDYLANKPQYVEACASWAYGRWGVQSSTASLKNALHTFKEGTQIENPPLTIVATNKENGLPIGMGSLWENDGEQWSERTPWIAAIFTLYRYRGEGVATAIIKRLEEEARRLGYKEVYLKSGSAATFYPKLGYKAIDSFKTNENSVGKETLFVKNL